MTWFLVPCLILTGIYVFLLPVGPIHTWNLIK